MMLRYRRSLVVLLPLVWLLLARWGHPQQDPGRGARIGDSVFLDTDNAAIKKLGAARDFLAAGQWNDAIELLRQIADQHGENVVPINDGRYVSVQSYCDMLLAGMGPDGLKLYRARVDPQARKWFETGRADRDEELVRKVVERAFASSFGDDALLLLGEWACERGDLSLARNCWQMLLPRERAPAAGEPLPGLAYPDTSLDQAAIRARLVLCSLLQGNLPRARAELADLTVRFPAATGEIAGRAGNLAKILGDAVAAAERSDAPADSPDISTFAFNPQRNKVLPMAVDVGAVQWQVDLVNFPKTTRGKAPQSEFPDRDRSLAMESLWYFPVIDNEIVFLCDDSSIYAWNLRTGKPAWPLAELQEPPAVESPEDPADIPADDAAANDVGRRADAKRKRPNANDNASKSPSPASVQNTARIFTLAAEHHRVWSGNTAGIPRFTMTVDQGRLFARLGAIPGQLQHTPSLLVCLDVEHGEGKPLWIVEGDKIQQGGESWTFEGAPLADKGYVYVALRRNKPRPQANVACFDAETGRLIWNRKVCIGLDLWPHVQEISQQLLTLAEDRLYYATNLGAVASIEARDGALRWVQTYRHLDIESANAFDRSQKYGPNPCLFHDGAVYVAPTDYDHVLAFDAETGVKKWAVPNRAEVPALLGANQGKLIVAGDDLRALKLDTGELAWPGRGGMRPSDPEGRGYGRGLLAEGLVYWTTREELLIVDQQTGVLKRRVSLTIPHNQGGGNLAISHGFLLVAQHDRLTAFCDHGLLEQRYSDDLARRPQSARLHYELACARESLGHTSDAIEGYRQAGSLIGDSDDRELIRLRSRAASRLFETHLRLAEQQVDEENYAEAVQTFGAALQAAPGAAQRLSALLGLARAEERNGHPEAAVAAYQTILESDELRPLHQAALVRGRIRDLVTALGRTIYAACEARAVAAFAEARGRNDGMAVETALQSFASAEAAESNALGFARQAAERESFQDANRVYRRLLQEDSSPAGRAAALMGLARVAEQQQYWHSAERWWRTLANEFASEPVASDGRDTPAKEFVASHLQQEQFQAERQSTVGPEVPLVRSWEHSSPGDNAIVPQGAPPSANLACVLLPGEGVICVDARQGTRRWQTPLQGRLIWSGFVSDLLILATPSEICAVTPEAGERVWEQRSGSNVELVEERPAPGEESGSGGSAAQRRSETAAAQPAPSFVALEDRVARLSPEGEVTLLDGHNGELAWSYRPRLGVLNRHWYCGPDWVALQLPGLQGPTLDAPEIDRTVVLNGRDGSVHFDLEIPIGRWSAPPLSIGGDRLAFVSDEGQVQALDLRSGKLCWSDAGPMLQASALPELLTNGTALLMVMDRDTLVKLDRDTGRRLWSRRVGSHPVRDPQTLAHVDAESVYLASGGVLRCFALKTGKLNWEQYLGAPENDWRAARRGNQVWAWPTACAGRSAIVVCDRQTGETIERLPLEQAADAITLWPSREFALVAAGHNLFGLRPLAAPGERGVSAP